MNEIDYTESTKKILSKLNFSIILLISVIISVFFINFDIQTRFSRLNSNEELKDVCKNINSITDEIKSLQKSDNKIIDQKDQINIPRENTDNQLDSFNKEQQSEKQHNISKLALNIILIKDIIYKSGDYAAYTHQFEQYLNDHYINETLKNIDNYAANNISIIELLDILDSTNSSQINNDISPNSSTTIMDDAYYYINNIIKIKRIDNKLSESKMKKIKNHIINRDFELAMDEINETHIENNIVKIFKEKLSLILSFEKNIDDFIKYISSDRFLKNNLIELN